MHKHNGVEMCGLETKNNININDHKWKENKQ